MADPRPFAVITGASSGIGRELARQFAAQPSVRYGLTTMCVGLGMGGTVLWENLNVQS